jgi:ADP-dependent NAD(P)H-hydrate dehydratase / NAD(P)H-hydrate epimerase
VNRIVSTAEMQALERAAAAAGLSESVLMENAGRQLAEVASQHTSPGDRVVVFCGSGNNGGDGYVAARHLLLRGSVVEAIAVAPPKTPDSIRNARAFRYVGGSVKSLVGQTLSSADVFGTGLRAAPRGTHARGIAKINALREAGATVIAADVPSGVNADSAEVFSGAVVANVTVVFQHFKAAHCTHPALSHAGTLVCVDLGIADEKVTSSTKLFLLDEGTIREKLVRRAADSHKGSYGHVLVLGGRRNKTGAAALSAIAALRSGAGLVTVATESQAVDSVLAHAPEVMGFEIEANSISRSIQSALQNKSAIVIGPGLGTDSFAQEVIYVTLSKTRVPCVLDADALNVLSTTKSLKALLRKHHVLTPHPGEMARLTGSSTRSVQAARIATAREFSQKLAVTVVLKGAQTLIAAADGTVYVNPTGNAGMATAGSGDVLAGVVGALLAQGQPNIWAGAVGAFAHGLAADLMVQRTGHMGLIASDIVRGLPQVWTRWNR